jgi:hypothetical protein
MVALRKASYTSPVKSFRKRALVSPALLAWPNWVRVAVIVLRKEKVYQLSKYLGFIRIRSI